MKRLILGIVAGLMSSCSAPIMKRAHVIPIYDGQVLVSAQPEFIGAGKSIYDDSSFTRPKVWCYEQLTDGSTMVHWISRPHARERLALIDSGFHPIVVPSDAVVTISGSDDHLVESQPPTVIEITGTNTAFVPDHVTLVPYDP